MLKGFSRFVALAPLAVAVALAIQSTEARAQNAPAAPAPTLFNPGVGDLMNMIVQPHHTKLWFAGHEGNWTLAEYEAKEVRSALANVAKARPVFRQQSVSEKVEMFLGGPFRAVDEAIKDRDAAKFTEAYASINTGCNSCHTALNQSQVVIRTPEQGSYPDQEFRPK